MRVVIRIVTIVAMSCIGSGGGTYAATYALVCQSNCIAPDGTTQPSGTVIGRVVWDGSSPYNPPGLTVVTDSGQTVYVSSKSPTSIASSQFFARFTNAEIQALNGNSIASVIVTRLLSNFELSVADPVIIGYMNQAVAAGLLSQSRANQILNLVAASP